MRYSFDSRVLEGVFGSCRRRHAQTTLYSSVSRLPIVREVRNFYHVGSIQARWSCVVCIYYVLINECL